MDNRKVSKRVVLEMGKKEYSKNRNDNSTWSKWWHEDMLHTWHTAKARTRKSIVSCFPVMYYSMPGPSFSLFPDFSKNM